GDQRNVVVRQVQVGAVEVVGEERAAVAAFLPAGAVHEVVDDQLAVAAEQLGERLAAVGAVELIGLVDPDPGQRTALGAELVALAGEGLFPQQVLAARAQPFFPRYHAGLLQFDVAGHGAISFVCCAFGLLLARSVWAARAITPPAEVTPAAASASEARQ